MRIVCVLPLTDAPPHYAPGQDADAHADQRPFALLQPPVERDYARLGGKRAVHGIHRILADLLVARAGDRRAEGGHARIAEKPQNDRWLQLAIGAGALPVDAVR